jgi:hypothetical protein
LAKDPFCHSGRRDLRWRRIVVGRQQLDIVEPLKAVHLFITGALVDRDESVLRFLAEGDLHRHPGQLLAGAFGW